MYVTREQQTKWATSIQGVVDSLNNPSLSAKRAEIASEIVQLQIIANVLQQGNLISIDEATVLLQNLSNIIEELTMALSEIQMNERIH